MPRHCKAKQAKMLNAASTGSKQAHLALCSYASQLRRTHRYCVMMGPTQLLSASSCNAVLNAVLYTAALV
jgi:glycine cleavage system protein P-like pyridoxal-binding family